MNRSTFSRLVVFASILVGLFVLYGCSGGGNVLEPSITNPSTAASITGSENSRDLWGMWQVAIDPDSSEVTIVPLRSAEFNLNLMLYLQPPKSPTQKIKVAIVGAQSDPTNKLYALDITLTHPFPTLKQFRGFDVHGIFMANASMTAEHNTSILYPDWFGAAPSVPGVDTVLLNADGYSRWWNPTEFTSFGTQFGYTPGLVASPGYLSPATMNPYKFFADELTHTGDLVLDVANRGTFSPLKGSNVRRYMVQFGAGPAVFNYAVDGAWAAPDPLGAPNYDVQWFPPAANAQEPYQIKLTDAGSTVWWLNDVSKGGEFILDFEVFDWQADTLVNPNAVLNQLGALWIESPAFDFAGSNFTDILTGTYELLPGTGTTSSIFRVHLTPDFTLGAIEAPGDYPVLIGAEAAFPVDYEPQIGAGSGGFAYPTEPLTAYQVGRITVGGASPVLPPVVTNIIPSAAIPNIVLNDVRIIGQNFIDGATVEFAHETDPFSTGPLASTFINSTEVWVDLDLTGAPLGFYDITVVNPDLQEGTLLHGFQVANLQQALIFENDVQLTPVWSGADSFTPAIAVEIDGDIVIAYEEHRIFNNQSDSMSRRSLDDGLTWPDSAHNMWSSGGYFRHWDMCKIWPNSYGESFRTMQLYDPIGNHWASGFLTETFHPGGGEVDQGVGSQWCIWGCELVQDMDKYLLSFSDAEGEITFKMSAAPEDIEATGQLWALFPDYPVAASGRLSNNRSSALYNDTMYLAYYEADVNNRIILARNTVDFQTWDTSWVAYDASDGFVTDIRNPGLFIDNTGYYITFTASDSDIGTNILYSVHSTDGANWGSPVEIHDSFGEIRDTPISGYVWNGTHTLGTIWYEGGVNAIYASFSKNDGVLWSPPILVNAGTGACKQPDMVIDPLTGYWHFVYAQELTTNNNRIHYRRAYLGFQ